MTVRAKRKKSTASPNRCGVPPVSKDYFYDAAEAARVCEFFPRFLRHVDGDFIGKPFFLEPWETDIVSEFFGWRHKKTGARRYRTLYLELPRKSGKSTFGAGLGLYLLFSDSEPRAQIYSAAADREQAHIIFDLARDMVADSPALKRNAKIYKTSIVVPRTRSFYRVLSREARTKWGFGAHGILFDELHAQPDQKLWDALVTSTGARRQPATISITTAGYDRQSVCWDQHEYARKVREGIIEDDSFLGVVYAAEKDDDWTDPKIWAKANPNLGVSVQPAFLEQECRKAKAILSYQNTFRRLYLNQWTQQAERWMDLDAWLGCGGPVDWRKLRGRACFGGLDLSSNTDLTALVLVFPPAKKRERYKVLAWHWMPKENVAQRVTGDGVPYDRWIDQGWLMETPGNIIDYSFVFATLAKLTTMFDIQLIGFDRWRIEWLADQLSELPLDFSPYGQGFKSMAPAVHELERLILAPKLCHGDNPVLTWEFDNVVMREDPAGNRKPDKALAPDRIDGMVALIMAVGIAILDPDVYSGYESQDLRTLPA